MDGEDGTILRSVAVDDSTIRMVEAEVGETGSDLVEDAGQQDLPAVVAAAVISAKVDMVQGVIERDESDGRKKRKTRENGVDITEDVDTREERKKRKDERERRRGRDRDSREGSDRREHREGRERKDSKRKKYRKERREEKDGKSRKHRSLEVDEELDGRRNEAKGGVEGELIHDFQSSTLVDISSTKHTSVSETVLTTLPADDDKEEGEIVEEDLSSARVAESEAESGEIQTGVEKCDDSRKKPISEENSEGKMKCSKRSASGAQLPSTVTNFPTSDRIGKASSRSFQDKAGQAASLNPLQSMLGIAEAYDSESPLSDEKNGLPSIGRAENVRDSRKTEDLSRRSCLRDSDRKSGPEKEKVEFPGQSTDIVEQHRGEHRDKVSSKIEDLSTFRMKDRRGRSGVENEAEVGDFSQREQVQEPPGIGITMSKLRRHSDSSEREDSQRVEDFRVSDTKRRRTPSPAGERTYGKSGSPSREIMHAKNRRKGRSTSPRDARDKDRRRGRSRSKDKRTERARSRSPDSTRNGISSRRRSQSPEAVRERGSRRPRSPSRDSPRDRRIERVRRSRSRDSDSERRHYKNKSITIERRRRSRSRDSVRVRSSGRGDSAGRRRHSRSRDSSRERNRDGGRRQDSIDKRRRSKSRSRDGKIEDRAVSRQSLERRRRSRSKESVRDHRMDERDTGRHGRRGDDSHHKSSRDDRALHDGRHNESSRDVAHRLDRVKNRSNSNVHDKSRSSKDLKGDGLQQSGRGSMDVDAIREEENQEEYQERVASQLAAQEDDDVDRVKEESRKRRQAILEKYKSKQEKPTEKEVPTGPGHSTNGSAPLADVAPRDLATGKSSSPAHLFSPSSDELSLGETFRQNGAMPSQAEGGGVGSGTPTTPKGERFEDMFGDDIFGGSPAGGRRLGKGDGVTMDTSGLTDNWDDAEGYYCFRIGEVLDGRYEVASSHGRGVFSTVVRARDLKAGRVEPEEVAIKIIRNNETMYKAGQQELVILKKVAGADPENKRHCVRLLSSFEYRSHLCLVFESLHMNLREILKKFGRNIGINLNAVRAYAKQLFISLKHLRNCGVLHCDIKPDNMLVNESKNVLKLCDFGSAMFAGENEITPYLVSRFYRAPEIILGLPYDHALDIWSVGCCLYELYTGKMLFPGHTNNDMLRLHMELKGPFPKKMLRKGAFTDQHFDQDFNFCAIEEDPVTKKAIKRILVNKPRDVGILVSSSGTDEDPKMLTSFKDLLEKIFVLDPDKRLTVSQALSHAFISGK